MQPMIPTYIALIGAAVVPIYAASHASLSRPSSATKPKPKKGQKHGSQDSLSQRMEGLSPSDAIWYPVMTGSLLVSLYYLIQWLKDPDILNKIINGYLSIFGIFSTAKLISDTLSVLVSFIFPDSFADQGTVWEIDSEKETVNAADAPTASSSEQLNRKVPLPGLLSRLPLSSAVLKGLWKLRHAVKSSWLQLEIFAKGLFEVDLLVGLNGILGLGVSVVGLLYFNFVSKPWWLTNLFGFSFSYSALQLMSPTTFWTGTLVLTSLFFYDIYFVFFTPMMITVATKLDVPVKLLIPKPGVTKDPAKPAKMELAMLGLGDIVLPGMMIGLALRFDLYNFYLNKQKRKTASNLGEGGNAEDLTDSVVNAPNDTGEIQFPVKYDATGLGKAEYVKARGSWGERFWLGKKDTADVVGGRFPKPYFYASLTGYVLGMICTVCVGQIYKHGQPALLYLVPSVLLAQWGTAWRRGELQRMWNFTEDESSQVKGKDSKKVESIGSDGTKKTSKAGGQQGSEDAKSKGGNEGAAIRNESNGILSAKEHDSNTSTPEDASSEKLETNEKAKDNLTTEQRAERQGRYFYIAIRKPTRSDAEAVTIELAPEVVSGLKAVSKGPVGQESDAEATA
ncbi:hypothetical protein MMC10_009425 [Thelotrema lepadinum]|nr:hypothetical protein [Thelotrema lepadinum]